MRNVMVLGDIHGKLAACNKAIHESKHRDYSKIVQVGDFGLWDHLASGVRFLDELNDILAKHGRKLYALGGNHENWDHWNWYVEGMPKDKYGFAILRSHILLAPRVHKWTWENKRFMMVAGAVSIDKSNRLSEERAGSPKQWWWQEEITDAEIDSIPNQKVDYLFTHDCSNATPWGQQLIPILSSQIHRQRIDTVLKKTLPEMHFHGHMHRKYDWLNRLDGDNWCQTYGLAHDYERDAWGILNLETNTFQFHPYK